MRHLPLLMLLTLALPLAACGGDDGLTDCEQGSDDADADGDGWTVGAGDCDDCDASVYPGAPEESETDGWDQDCDGPGE